VAISDPLRITSRGLEVVPRPRAVERIAAIVAEEDVKEVVIGLPLGLDGREGEAAGRAREFARELAEAIPVPIRLIDERFTTSQAEADMSAAGVGRIALRGAVDKVAAAIILRTFLDRGR
jgi:putative Holliday junction resolvase